MDVIGDNEVLKQGFMNVLHHKDALWGPGDFSLPEEECAMPETPNHTSPEFLQPRYKPQLRLPSLSTELFPTQFASRWQHLPHSTHPGSLRSQFMQHAAELEVLQTQHTHNQEVVNNGYGDHDRYKQHGPHVSYQPAYARNPYTNWNPFTPNDPSSPISLMPGEAPLSHHYASPSRVQTTNFHPHAAATYATEFESPDYESAEHAQQTYAPVEQWRGNDHDVSWSGFGAQYPPEHQHILVDPQEPHRSAVVDTTPTTAWTSSYLDNFDVSPTTVETSTTAPFGYQPALDTFPLSVRDREDNAAFANFFGRGGNAQLAQLPLATQSAVTHALEASRSKTKERASPNSGNFVHAICGKHFQSRRSVKKHHWGPQADNIATKTGCWAKHGKPNREW